MMTQFFHSHPMDNTNGIRACYHIVDGKCTYLFYLPDQKIAVDPSKGHVDSKSTTKGKPSK